MNRLVRFALLPLLVFVAGACQVTPRAEDIQVRDFPIANRHPYALHIEVHGGLDQMTMPVRGHMPLPNEELAAGVRESFAGTEVFARVAPPTDADYRLDVVFGNYIQPHGGVNLTSSLTLLWSLSESESQRTVWQEFIETSYTATVRDAFVGATRARICAEETTSDNIRQAISRISELDLRGPGSGTVPQAQGLSPRLDGRRPPP